MAEDEWSDEARRPEEPPRQPLPPDQWDAQAPPPKAGMSGGMKAVLIVLAVLGCCFVLCCGIGGFFAYTMVPKVSQAAADVNAARDEMAKIDLPAGFDPVRMMKMDNFMMSMIFVQYQKPAIHGEISLAEMQLKVGDAAQRDQAMRQQLERQGFGPPKRLNNAKSETKKIMIKGHESDFRFQTGDDPVSKKKARQISGVFDGNHGPVSINIEMDDSAYNENAIVNMLESIR